MAEIEDAKLAELEAKAAKVEELEKVKNDSDAKMKEFETAKAEWEKKEKEYQAQSNPNWQKARSSMESMRKALEEKGVKVDDDGNIVSNPNNVDVSAIETKAREAARSEILGGRLEELLGQYDTESAKVVRVYYNKLTAGETVTLQNINSFLQQAESAAKGVGNVEIKRIHTAYSAGSGPRSTGDDKGELDDSVAMDLGKRMGLPFASEDNK